MIPDEHEGSEPSSVYRTTTGISPALYLPMETCQALRLHRRASECPTCTRSLKGPGPWGSMSGCFSCSKSLYEGDSSVRALVLPGAVAMAVMTVGGPLAHTWMGL
eukprot:753241-Hanusia_phi.AAC.1